MKCAAADPNNAFLLVITALGEANDRVSCDQRGGVLRRGSLGRTHRVTKAAVCATIL